MNKSMKARIRKRQRELPAPPTPQQYDRVLVDSQPLHFERHCSPDDHCQVDAECSHDGSAKHLVKFAAQWGACPAGLISCPFSVLINVCQSSELRD